MIPLTVPEVRRLVRAMGEPDAQRGFRFGWSRWRRAHQEIAARCHAARRARGRDRPSISGAAIPLAPGEAELTNLEWERVRPLLPPQKHASSQVGVHIPLIVLTVFSADSDVAERLPLTIYPCRARK